MVFCGHSGYEADNAWKIRRKKKRQITASLQRIKYTRAKTNVSTKSGTQRTSSVFLVSKYACKLWHPSLPKYSTVRVGLTVVLARSFKLASNDSQPYGYRLRQGLPALCPANNFLLPCFKVELFLFVKKMKKSKVLPLQAMQALRGRGRTAPTHSWPRH
jgi:hypothetical protein